MNDDQSYEKLIEHCNTWIYGLPESDLLRPLLKLRLTPEEAEFLSGFPHLPATVEQLAVRFGMPQGQLLDIMRPMLEKGFIMHHQGKSSARYAFTDPVFFLERMPGYKGVDDEWNRKISPLINRYYIESQGADFMGHATKGLRSIPIARTIKPESLILPYEDVLGFVAREDFHSVSACACRHRHNLDPTFGQCPHEKETCLHFGSLGRYTVKYGIGREITREETLDILAKAANAGLVHGMSNTKTGMDTICNCCPCCCLLLEKIKISNPCRSGHQRSNYILEMNGETCKTCGLCVKRCPVGALDLIVKQEVHPKSSTVNTKESKQITYDQELCIGCGVCAHKCPTRSLSLVPRGKEENIPANMMEAGQRLLTERSRDMSKVF
jgi:Na+-translocating ferredoxin:NAD+ oxidoreductase subunit B